MPPLLVPRPAERRIDQPVTDDLCPRRGRRPHHVLAVQAVQHGAEQVGAGLQVGLAGVVVQLAAQLVGDQRQQDVPAVCGAEPGAQ